MQYSPTNEGGLLALVQALKGGMTPDAGMQMYGMIEQQQAQETAQRQERLGGLASLLTNAATSGMPYAGAEALAGAQPGPMGPAVQSMLESFYPNSGGQAPTPDLNYRGAVMDGPEGSAPSPGGLTAPVGPYGMQYGVEDAGPQAISPAMDPMIAMQQQAAEAEMMGAQQAAQTEPIWAEFMAIMADAKASNIPPDQAFTQFAQANPNEAGLLSGDQSRLTGVLEAIFGGSAMQYAGNPAVALAQQ
jgi:hypothetical protein